MAMPHSPAAEHTIVASALKHPERIGELQGAGLDPSHFYLPDMRALYAAIVENYYAGETIDPITIGEACRTDLARQWGIEPTEVTPKLEKAVVGRQFQDNWPDYAKMIRDDSSRRALVELAQSIEREITEGTSTPEQVADLMSLGASKIATEGLAIQDSMSFGDLGRWWIKEITRLTEMKRQGVEPFVRFGLDFIDNWTEGLQPSELLICASEAGAGKSSLWWEAARRFAMNQLQKPGDEQIGSLIMSLEMSAKNSGDRIAQSVSGIPGSNIRGLDLHDLDIDHVRNQWGRLKNLPLHFHFSSTIKASQLRAVVTEHIRNHNVGLLVIDHFRYFDMDKPNVNPVQHDEDKARFLKQDLAKQLNIAVVCLAHTVKIQAEDGRPRMKDLRGSGQMSAEADFLNFLYRPHKYASLDAVAANDINPTDAELLWEKSRHSFDGVSQYTFDAPRMEVKDR